ncbi:MAG: lysylphosphatidylglycerol synthase domain-containing protein [Candidatus Binataceae bacterium]
MIAADASPPREPPVVKAAAPLWRTAIPYAGTVIIFALIFWRISASKVAADLRQVPIAKFVAIFLPYSIFYCIVDSYCLAWVVRRFNAPMRWRDILPIRASMYVLAMLNTGLAQGGLAYYLHRKGGFSFLSALSSILFIAMLEIYQLFLFSTVGVLFYTPVGATQARIIGILRVVYLLAWTLLFGVMVFFAMVRRRPRIRAWVENGRAGAIARTFIAARPIDYAAVLAIKAPTFIASAFAHYFALSIYGVSIPLLRLILFLPLVFLAGALPISIAHLGTSQAAWLLFFAGTAAPAKLVAYSLVAQFTYMFCNALIGVFFVPRASRELTAIRQSDPEVARA